jgi:hypothetical protein
MYFDDDRLQYPVQVDSPNPLYFYAKMLQQAIGGVESEIRTPVLAAPVPEAFAQREQQQGILGRIEDKMDRAA